VHKAMDQSFNGYAYSATDLLHRRTALPFRFQASMGEAAIEIRTNSQLCAEAIRESRERHANRPQRRIGRWEIEVETQSPEGACVLQNDIENGCETFAFGPSRSFRMGDGSWFAHTPPAVDGVGFAFVAGDAGCQVEKLRLFLGLVSEFVLESVAEGILCLEQDKVVA
jgi:hypothetical protein